MMFAIEKIAQLHHGWDFFLCGIITMVKYYGVEITQKVGDFNASFMIFKEF